MWLIDGKLSRNEICSKSSLFEIISINKSLSDERKKFSEKAKNMNIVTKSLLNKVKPVLNRRIFSLPRRT